MKHLDKLKILAERFGQSWSACMVAMVQGDLSVLTLKHAMVASKTGLIAGIAMVIASFVPNQSKWFGLWLIGLFTMIADYMTHPTHFGNPMSESIVTGIGAVIIALIYEKVKGKKNV